MHRFEIQYEPSVAEIQSGQFKTNTPINQVGVLFPRMHSPFAKCFWEDPEKENIAPPKIHQVTVSFRSEEKSQALQEFRHFQEVLNHKIHELVHDYCQLTTFVGKAFNIASLVKNPIDPDSDFKDKITLRFRPENEENAPLRLFLSPAGDHLKEADLDFREFDIQCIGWFRDVYKYKQQYFPRMFLVECVMYPKL